MEDALENIKTTLNEAKSFMKALERLAVTSEHVVNMLSVDPRPVGKVLSVVRDVAPWLLMFKRNPTEFFSPKLQNIEPLELQLQVYITALRSMCRPLQDSDLKHLCLDTPQVHLPEELSEEQRTRIISHIQELQQLREDESFRLRFLLRDKDQTFISEFRQKELKEPEMQKCLDDLEECAVKVDRMHRGRLVSGVISSSVGLVGGAASIAGLCKMPTDIRDSDSSILLLTEIRDSSILLLTGLILSAVSGVIRLTTMIADVWEKKTPENKS
ncbi:hypothetical protein WMY93_032648 [Mugilogobius chulae]|uniref:Uncharacterized protein n=1 Tax=Mugilogobius chulae TaxID=88201 RepID=A0AAW0MW85_9GOBI